MSSKLRTNWLCQTSEKSSSHRGHRRKIPLEHPVPSCLTQSHPPHWCYRFRVSTDGLTVQVRNWTNAGEKKKQKKNQMKGQIRSQELKFNQADNIEQRNKNQPSSVYFVSPCLPALFISLTCSADWKHNADPVGYSVRDAHPLELGQGFSTWNCLGLRSVTSVCFTVAPIQLSLSPMLIILAVIKMPGDSM